MAFSFTKIASSFDKLKGGADFGFEVLYGTGSLGASYTTGGESVTAALLGMTGGTLHGAVVSGWSNDGAIAVTYDDVNDKILAFDAFGTQEGAATDLSAAGKKFTMIAIVTKA